MNVLITGGLGGLGRELAGALADDGRNRVITYSRRALLDDASGSGNICHEQGSIHDTTTLHRVMSIHGITHIVHAAGARTRECERSLDAAREANVAGTQSVLNAAGAIPAVSRLIFLSSAAVYGHTTGDIDESQPVNPGNNYALTKAEAEAAVTAWAAQKAVQTVIVRPGFLLGPQAEGGLSSFLRQIALGEAPRLAFPEHFHLHGLGDAARALVALLGKAEQTPAAVYHLPGHDLSIGALADAITAALPDSSLPARFHIESAPSSWLPERLAWARFEQTCGPFSLTSLRDLVRSCMAFPLSQ